MNFKYVFFDKLSVMTCELQFHGITTFREQILTVARQPDRRQQHLAVGPLRPTQCCCRYHAACNVGQQAYPALKCYTAALQWESGTLA